MCSSSPGTSCAPLARGGGSLSRIAATTSLAVSTLKRRASGDHLVEHYTEAEDVCSRIYLCPRACSGDIYRAVPITIPVSVFT